MPIISEAEFVRMQQEIKDLRREREKAEARIAELEDQLSKAIAHGDCNYGYGKENGL